MNRQDPPRLVATPPAAPGTGKPAAHPPVWYYGPSIPIIGSNGPGIFGFYLALLMLLPGYGLTMLIITGLEGVAPSHGPSTKESFMLFLLGFAVLIGMFFAWIASAPQVQAFTFDENRQLLTLTVTRRSRKPTEVCVPFSDISSIRPYVVAASDRNGYFHVEYRDPKGKFFEYDLGDGTSLENMEFHAAWLRGMIGERMHELLNLDK